MKTRKTASTDTSVVQAYEARAAKKGPVLVVRFMDGTMLQFPADSTYDFRRVCGVQMCVVSGGGRIVGHIAMSQLRSITGPEYLIRDGDAR